MPCGKPNVTLGHIGRLVVTMIGQLLAKGVAITPGSGRKPVMHMPSTEYSYTYADDWLSSAWRRALFSGVDARIIVIRPQKLPAGFERPSWQTCTGITINDCQMLH